MSFGWHKNCHTEISTCISYTLHFNRCRSINYALLYQTWIILYQQMASSQSLKWKRHENVRSASHQLILWIYFPFLKKIEEWQWKIGPIKYAPTYMYHSRVIFFRDKILSSLQCNSKLSVCPSVRVRPTARQPETPVFFEGGIPSGDIIKLYYRLKNGVILHYIAECRVCLYLIILLFNVFNMRQMCH